MRSKIAKRILDETPQEVKDKVQDYANKLILNNVVGNEVRFESGLTCMMCREPKEKDGHTCCEDCAGLAF